VNSAHRNDSEKKLEKALKGMELLSYIMIHDTTTAIRKNCEVTGSKNAKIHDFFLGCAIWAYKGWIGEVFPSGSRAADFLTLYSDRFTTVEGNTTFYSIPSPETVARWKAETPSGFKFCPKLPKAFTHHGLLEPFIPNALNFLELMQGLGDRLGPIFAQLPPSYSPDQFNDLTQFLQAWPQASTPLALEVRHLDWFQEPYASKLDQVLQTLQIGRVLLDTRPIYECNDDPQIGSERRKPQLPLQFRVTAPFTLIRFISHPQQELNILYLEEWLQQIRQWLTQGVQVFFIVHCPVEARSPKTARQFQHLLEDHQILVPPLPWDVLERSTHTQLSLF
jgi:uncharacterized protein YecE (DUF72 family)